MKNSIRFGTAVLVGLLLAPVQSLAGDDDKKPEPPRPVCFNILCQYQSDQQGQEGHEGHECQAAARFRKLVGHHDVEIWDRSEAPENPVFEVECDGQVIFNNTGYRFTDGYGTRIQAEGATFPSILLPKGTLVDKHRYVPSALELEHETLKGYCFVYTGPQLF